MWKIPIRKIIVHCTYISLCLDVKYMNSLTENNYSCTDNQLDEIHQALIKEFSAVSRKQTEQKIKLLSWQKPTALTSAHDSSTVFWVV